MSEDRKLRVLVVGDIMIDRYVFVSSERNAAEAPIPVFDELKEEKRLGGAANTAHNLKVIGGDEIEVDLAGIVDSVDRTLIQRLGIGTEFCTGYETMMKTRYVSSIDQKYLFRADNMKKFPSYSIAQFKKNVNYLFFDMTNPTNDSPEMYDAIIFSDYDKGTIDSDTVNMFKNNSRLFVIDSKKVDLSIYEGMNVLKINEGEYSIQVSRGPYTNVEKLFDFVIVTHGSKGSELRQCEKVKSNDTRYMIHSETFPVDPVAIGDVTGCGDTHTAALTFSLLKNGDIRNAVKFANACARSVVQKFGTSVVEK